MKNTKIRKHQAGDIILREGDYNKTLHKILSGKVALYLNYGKSNEYLIETLSFPQYFGEVSILIQHPSYCTAVAIEDTAILHIPAENFNDFIQSNTQNAFLIMKAMAKSLDSLNTLLHKIELGDHPHIHTEISEELPLFSTQEFLSMPDSKTLFMQEHIEDELHEAFTNAEKEKNKEIDLLVQQTMEANRMTQNREDMVLSIMQSIAQEAEKAQQILPEVYPDFFLPGHKSYPDITHPEYKEFLFHKEYTCPNCKQTFDGSRISYNRLTADPVLSQKMRMDFHIFYKDFEAEWYDIVTCPHCYFSTLIDMFLKPTYLRKAVYEEQLMQIRSSVMLDFSAERTLDFVFLQHYIALACSAAFSNHIQIDACLWMNLCWLYRSVEDQEMIRQAEDKTLEAYKDMYLNCSLSPEQEQRTCLTIAGMYFDKGEYIPAREWAFAVRVYPEAKIIYRNLAQSIIDEARYLLSEQKKAEAAQKAEEEARKLAEAKEATRKEAEARKEEKLRKKEEAKIEEAVKKESAKREAEARKEAEASYKGWFPEGGHALT